jgi:hypothetical protein
MSPLPGIFTNAHIDASLGSQTTEGATSPPRQMAGGLRLIAYDESGFEDHVSSTYPLIANHELYPKARKFMAVLSHEGSRQAKAYRILWTIQQSPNRQRTMQAVYIQKHCMLRSAVLNVRPGKKRLVSMFFNYSTSDYNFRPESATLRVPPNFPFLDAELISVSIDAVIYSDRTIAGPDQYDLKTRYFNTRAAEHNEGYSLSWKLEKMKATLGPNETIDPNQIASILDYDVQYGTSRPGTDAAAMLRLARSQEAAIMKGLLTSRGLEALEKNVARRVKFPADRLTSIG